MNNLQGNIKKMQKAAKKGIVYGTETSFKIIAFRLPLKFMYKEYGEEGRKFIQKAYDRAKKELKKGEKIFNENLEELGVKL